MNAPSTTATAAGLGPLVAGLLMIALAMLWPDGYARLQVYPGAEAHIAGLFGFIYAWKVKETRYQMSPRD